MKDTDKEIRTYKKGQVIFRQGDYEPCMYDIQGGRVGIYADYETAGQKLLAEIQAEQYFGEMGLIEDCPRSATAVALENGTAVLKITENTFQSYFEKRPAKVLLIMEHLSRRLRDLTDDYMKVCRTIAEGVQSEESGEEKSGWLKEHLKKFAGVYRNSGK